MWRDISAEASVILELRVCIERQRLVTYSCLDNFAGKYYLIELKTDMAWGLHGGVCNYEVSEWITTELGRQLVSQI